MAADRVTAALDRIEELERRDNELAAGIERIGALLRDADGIRSRAAVIRERLGAIPTELAAAARSEAAAREWEAAAGVELAGAELRAAEAEQSRRAGQEARAQADRELARTRAALADAAARVARAATQGIALQEEERRLLTDLDDLGARARAVAEGVTVVPHVSASGRGEPAPGVLAIEEWGSRTHAALFVARSGLVSERQSIVDEACAIGTSVLGEHLAGTNVSLVRRRLQAYGTTA